MASFVRGEAAACPLSLFRQIWFVEWRSLIDDHYLYSSISEWPPRSGFQSFTADPEPFPRLQLNFPNRVGCGHGVSFRSRSSRGG